MSRPYSTDFSPEEIASVRQSFVANPEHLKETLDVVFGDAEANQSAYLYRSMFWLAFMGFEMRDVVELRTSHVDWEIARIYYRRSNNQLVWGTIPPEALPDLRNAAELETLAVSGESFERVYKRAAGDWLVRGMRSFDFKDDSECESYIKHSIRPILARSFREAETSLIERIGMVPEWCAIRLTFDRTIKSGVFYRFFERERAGLSTNLKNIYQAQYARPEDEGWDYPTFNAIYRRQYLLWRSAFLKTQFMP